LTITFTGFAGQSCDDAGGAKPDTNAVAIRKCAQALMIFLPLRAAGPARRLNPVESASVT
jgi:hypothetical protein